MLCPDDRGGRLAVEAVARAALFVTPVESGQESGRGFRFFLLLPDESGGRLAAEAVALAESIAGENRVGFFRFLDERRGVGGIVGE